MLLTPPEGFDLDVFFHDTNIFQSWEIFPGLRTTGSKDVAGTMDGLRIPRDLTGMRVLDIGPWNGFFSFECARRGATEVVSLGLADPDKITGYNKTKNLLRADNCRYIQANVYELSPHVHGKFDTILFLGVIYHLRYPLLALDRIFDCCTKFLYIDGPIIDNIVYDKTISIELREQIRRDGRVIHNLPMLYFTKGAESGDATNWFLPNKRGFRDLVEAGGFNVEHDGDDGGGWAWLSATRGTRRFAPGLEGFSTVAEGTLSVPEGNPEVSFAAGVPSLAQVEQMRREEVLASELARVTQERNWLANQSNQWFDAAIIAVAAPAWSRAQRRRWRLFPKPSRIILGQAKRTALRKADRACKAACWAQAARFYVDALAQDPSDSAVWAQLGQTLKAAGRDAEAKFACRKSVELGA